MLPPLCLHAIWIILFHASVSSHVAPGHPSSSLRILSVVDFSTMALTVPSATSPRRHALSGCMRCGIKALAFSPRVQSVAGAWLPRPRPCHPHKYHPFTVLLCHVACPYAQLPSIMRSEHSFAFLHPFRLSYFGSMCGPYLSPKVGC